jgi:hypothetical protein
MKISPLVLTVVAIVSAILFVYLSVTFPEPGMILSVIAGIACVVTLRRADTEDIGLGYVLIIGIIASAVLFVISGISFFIG